MGLLLAGIFIQVWKEGGGLISLLSTAWSGAVEDLKRTRASSSVRKGRMLQE